MFIYILALALGVFVATILDEFLGKSWKTILIDDFGINEEFCWGFDGKGVDFQVDLDVPKGFTKRDDSSWGFKKPRNEYSARHAARDAVRRISHSVTHGRVEQSENNEIQVRRHGDAVYSNGHGTTHIRVGQTGFFSPCHGDDV
ncbi:hypothetical protein Sjap_015172 [Stephania japonica]|uniref:Uncharacterized protein n=1 Tax=Stephania japonica TaxID=461633 RepID=A0AAP0IJ32_9MAGN